MCYNGLCFKSSEKIWCTIRIWSIHIGGHFFFYHHYSLLLGVNLFFFLLFLFAYIRRNWIYSGMTQMYLNWLVQCSWSRIWPKQMQTCARELITSLQNCMFFFSLFFPFWFFRSWIAVTPIQYSNHLKTFIKLITRLDFIRSVFFILHLSYVSRLSSCYFVLNEAVF